MIVVDELAVRQCVAGILVRSFNEGIAPNQVHALIIEGIKALHDPVAFVQQHIAAERFATWLALAPILDDMAELNRDNDDGDVTGYEVRLFLQRIHARLEAIGQGLHRFDDA